MKYCAQCGREVLDTEVVCPSCGYTFEEAQTVSYPQESTIWATLSTIFSWLSIVISPIFGLVFSIIGMSKYKDPALKAKCKSGLIRTIVITVRNCCYRCVLCSLHCAYYGNGGRILI